MSQRGGELRTLTQQQIDLIGRNIHIIDLVEGHLARRCTDERDGIARHQNIGIGRLAATIQHDIIYTMTKD